MTAAQRAEFQLRAVELAYWKRSPDLDVEALGRLRLRCRAILHGLKSTPGHDEGFDARLSKLRLALRPAV